MKLIERLWQDIRQGENIDLFISIVVSLVLVLLELFIDVPESVITPLLLTILALLSITNLGNRYRLETVIERIKPRTETLLAKFPDNLLYHDMDKAKELMLIGVDLNTVLKSNYARLEKNSRTAHPSRLCLLIQILPLVKWQPCFTTNL